MEEPTEYGAKKLKTGRKKKSEQVLKLTHRIEWDLLTLLAKHKIRTGVELKRLLDSVGYEISSVHAARLLAKCPSQIPINLLNALVTIFKCRLSDIMYEVPIDFDDPERAPITIHPTDQAATELPSTPAPATERLHLVRPESPVASVEAKIKKASDKLKDLERTPDNLAAYSFRPIEGKKK